MQWLATGTEANGTMQTLYTLAPFILMIAIFYFLLIRPQQKKQRERRTMLNALNKGDKIVTIGGLHGTVESMTDDTVVLKVNDVTKLTFDRSAISSIAARASESKSEG